MKVSKSQNRIMDPEVTGTNKSLEINLFASPNVSQQWVPNFLRNKSCWKVLSGNWRLELPNRVIYRRHNRIPTRENASIIGSTLWDDFHSMSDLRYLRTA
jgi:hypothetical protein